MKRLKRTAQVAVLIIAASLGWMASHILSGPDIVIPADASKASEVRFIAIGDSGSGGLIQHRVAWAMSKAIKAKQGIDFVALLGDNFYNRGVSSVNDLQWQYKFEGVYRGSYLDALPFYAVLGNHDYEGDARAQIDYTNVEGASRRWRMSEAQYAKDFGSLDRGRPLLRMVFLDTNGGASALSKQAEFLLREMNRGPQPIWRIAVGHHPVRSMGAHGNTSALVSKLLPTLKQAQVDLYISGHDHNLQLLAKRDEPAYLISGGGGKSVYPLNTQERSLLFGKESFGFALVEANAHRLAIDFYDASSTLLATYSQEAGCRESRCFAESERTPQSGGSLRNS